MANKPNIVEATAQRYKNKYKKKDGFLKNLLKIFGINTKMQNRAGGGGTPANGTPMTLDEIRRQSSGRY